MAHSAVHGMQSLVALRKTRLCVAHAGDHSLQDFLSRFSFHKAFGCLLWGLAAAHAHNLPCSMPAVCRPQVGDARLGNSGQQQHQLAYSPSTMKLTCVGSRRLGTQGRVCQAATASSLRMAGLSTSGLGDLTRSRSGAAACPWGTVTVAGAAAAGADAGAGAAALLLTLGSADPLEEEELLLALLLLEVVLLLLLEEVLTTSPDTAKQIHAYVTWINSDLKCLERLLRAQLLQLALRGRCIAHQPCREGTWARSWRT